MKALKEKRASLRSLFRRSLVVLSILALALAACGDSGSSDNGNGGGVNGPEVPPRTARSIILVNPEAMAGNIHFQGLPPTLTGAFIEVEWSDGTRESFTTLGADFYTIPPAIDNVGTPGPFRIAHRGSTIASNEFTPVHVVTLVNLNWVNTGDVIWYADRRPDFANLTLQGNWEWEATAAGLNFVDGGTPGTPNFRTRTAAIPLTAGYPQWGLALEGRNNTRIWAQIPNGTTPTAPGANAPFFTLTRFLQVHSVEVLTPPADFALFEDHWFVPGTPPTTAYNQTHLVNLVRDNNLQFRIYYDDFTTNRVIGWPEFLANWDYAVNELESVTVPGATLPVNIGSITDFVFSGGNAGFATGSDQGLLNIDDDTEMWDFVLFYVPKLYNQSAHPTGADTHVTMFNVDVPVFFFESLRPVTRRPGLPANANIWERQNTTAGPIDLELLRAINDRYILTMVYRRGATVRERTTPFTAAMFGNVTLVPLAPTPNLTAGQTYRNLPLNVTWRGETLEEEETINVDLFF
jgi:hypothetical protein